MNTRIIAAALGIALSAARSDAFAQAGSTGGMLGNTDKSISGERQGESPSQPKSREPKAASRNIVRLGISVRRATYGGNCGAPEGNMTSRLSAACNGKSQCDYVIDYNVIGDSVPVCQKNYVAEWHCGNGSVHSATVAPEAGFQKTITLNCN